MFTNQFDNIFKEKEFAKSFEMKVKCRYRIDMLGDFNAVAIISNNNCEPINVENESYYSLHKEIP
jgi:hypothetical protein